MKKSNVTISDLPEMLSTGECAEALRRERQTLRSWASTGRGPLRPVRVNRFGGPLLWRKSDVLRILNGGGPAEVEGQV